VAGTRGHVSQDGRVLTLLFHMYGIYGVGFLVARDRYRGQWIQFRSGERWAWWGPAGREHDHTGRREMAYDRIVGAEDPFELTKYLGLGVI
jgi:hypothetical protein